jgi:1-deoxy-D-xylulose-5-phosphate reductoisomerase
VSMAAGTNVDLLAKQVEKFRPELVSVGNEEAALALQERLGARVKPEIVHGLEGLELVARHQAADFVMTAVVGSVGVAPTLAAIDAGKTIGLANKETLVSAGPVVMKAAREKGIPIIPVDSEHSAVFQCLQGERREDVSRVMLTASGGSFRHLSREELGQVTVSQALDHPNWSMGAKITIDSATMMNKGFEVIEAHHSLYGRIQGQGGYGSVGNTGYEGGHTVCVKLSDPDAVGNGATRSGEDRHSSLRCHGF